MTNNFYSLNTDNKSSNSRNLNQFDKVRTYSETCAVFGSGFTECCYIYYMNHRDQSGTRVTGVTKQSRMNISRRLVLQCVCRLHTQMVLRSREDCNNYVVHMQLAGSPHVEQIR